MEAIKVHVVDKGRRYFYMRYRCPLTGKEETRSTGERSKKEAIKVAAKWEAELQEGRYQRSARMPWPEFRKFWEDHNLQDLTLRSGVQYASTFNAFETLCRPQQVGDLTTARVTAFVSELRKPRKRKSGETFHLSPASVGRHLRHLKAVARWAHRKDLLAKVPLFEMPKSSRGAKMKGRPITGEEFDRMLVAVPRVVGKDSADSWKLLLRGLWTSGLRLGEALALRWDHVPGGVSVALNGQKSVLRFEASAQKSGKAQVVALAPEAVNLLLPHQSDTGFVFTPERKDGSAMVRSVSEIGKTITRFGEKAGIVTNAETGKTASAHDLRRSFGRRWSRRVQPATLRELMRHASIETTMAYYVGEDALSTAGELWRASGDTLGDTSKSSDTSEERREAKNA